MTTTKAIDDVSSQDLQYLLSRGVLMDVGDDEEVTDDFSDVRFELACLGGHNLVGFVVIIIVTIAIMIIIINCC